MTIQISTTMTINNKQEDQNIEILKPYATMRNTNMMMITNNKL
jgi:hypothetical protein